jgi:sterol desaturase/sphingolipid hydroxylase (fatty acid hydroxylase superfamily)
VLAPAPAVLAAVAILLAWRGWVALGAASGADRAVASEGLVLIGPAVLALVAVVVCAEQLWPVERRPLLARGHRQDALYLALYALLVVPAVTLIGAGFATSLLRLAPWLVVHPVSFIPRYVLVALVLILMDACNWAAHFLNHRVTTFWRYHALHHSQEEMSILTSFRAHPLVHASFQIAAVPIIVLGTSGAVPVPVLIAYVLLSTLPHANVPWTYGPLRRVVVNPAYHRYHHDRTDTRGVNLGTVLVVWDVMAGLAVFPPRSRDPLHAPIATGLSGRPIPVEQAPDARGILITAWRQLTEPAWNTQPATATTAAATAAASAKSPTPLPAQLRQLELEGASHA